MTAARQWSVKSATLFGVKAIPVDVEVVISTGIPGFSIVGMADAAIHESRERVKAALRACGYAMPNEKVVVNLAPGSLKKSGTGFDLPIAAALLVATGQIPAAAVEDCLVVGELSLDGGVRAVKGMLAFEMCAHEFGCSMLCAAPDDGLVDINGLTVKTLDRLSRLRTCDFAPAQCVGTRVAGDTPDYVDVGGHAIAKRALKIAAAGNHGLLMMGPPGSGKTMLASRLPGILPPLTEAESMETALVHSVAGLDITGLLNGVRPFRAPHHCTTSAGLTGGGQPIRPGELSLAHNGVLFLDELAEFRPSVLQGIRQPMEDGHVSITRAEGNVVFPSNFMLIAACNPCPCGHFGDAEVACTCSPSQVQTYQNRIGGPLIDRFDMAIDVWRSDFKQVVARNRGETTAQMREDVLIAREFAAYRRAKSGACESIRNIGALLESCNLTGETESYLETVADGCSLSGRGIMRTLSVARTIADMQESASVEQAHIAEAVSMRLRSAGGM